jgi:hypothetical protein
LFRSDPFPNTSTVYTDNGSAFTSSLKSSDLPKAEVMSMKQVIESTIELSAAGASVNYGINVYDDAGNFITGSNVLTQVAGALWGSNLWGDGSVWKSSLNQPKTYQIEWTAPLVFNKLAIEVSAIAGSSVAIGTFFARFQKTGYMLQPS